MSTRRRLIEVLADGRFHTGPELGATLDSSRSAVWKALHQLTDLGLEIESHPQHGYRLPSPVHPLNQERLQAALGERGIALGGLHLLEETDSTNDWLRQRLRAPGGTALSAPTLCLAEYQRAGRGRRGRSWLAPAYGNLCLSLYWRSEQDPARLAGLGPALAVGVVRALEGLGASGLALKWPNDILLQGRDGAAKLAGLLLELDATGGGPCHLVIGLGLNLQLSDALRRQIDQPAAGLDQALDAPADRHQVAAAVVAGLLQALDHHHQSGLTPFLDDWQRLDLMQGRRVRVEQGLHPIHGQVRGIDPADGALLLHTAAGLRRLHSGDISLRAQP